MVIDPSRLGIYVLDVGQGDCTFIVPPEGEGDPILFDCADAPTAERFIANHRINRLEAVVASHLDEDHVGGLLPLLKAHFEEGGEVGTFFLSADRAVSRRITKVLAALLNQAETWEKEFAARGFVRDRQELGQRQVQVGLPPGRVPRLGKAPHGYHEELSG